MFANDADFKNDLVAHKIYSSWQFIQFAQENINIAEYCYNTINQIMEKLNNKAKRWEQELFSDSGKTGITQDDLPDLSLYTAGLKVDPWFLFYKLLRDFYQYAANSFDSMSQIVNEALLANQSRPIDSVGFSYMRNCLKRDYLKIFPKMTNWFNTTAENEEFEYLTAVNNRTKHTAGIKIDLSIGIFGSHSSAQIGSFCRKNTPHEEKELLDKISKTREFLDESWHDFLSVLCDEYQSNTYIENRRHAIGGVHQQISEDDPTQNFSYAYIPVEGEFASMSDSIRILLVSGEGDNVRADNCTFEHILVKDTAKDKILGQYKMKDKPSEDCLLSYREYIKDTKNVGKWIEWLRYQEKNKIYWKSPFFDIETTTLPKKNKPSE